MRLANAVHCIMSNTSLSKFPCSRGGIRTSPAQFTSDKYQACEPAAFQLGELSRCNESGWGGVDAAHKWGPLCSRAQQRICIHLQQGDFFANSSH